MSNDKNLTVCVIGLGYIGLPTAALLASCGYEVYGMDVNHHAVETINKGEIHIVEPELDGFVKSAVDMGRLKASTEVTPADVYMICVPTPFRTDKNQPEPDLSYVEAAAKNITPFIKSGDLVILESTSPVGATEIVADLMAEGGVNLNEISVAYCPERVLPGKIMRELVENDRIVGGINQSSADVAGNFYESFVKGAVLLTNARTAEMCKLTENSFRDINIAFANELSLICDEENIDVWELISLANRHPRVNVLSPGTGVGGHCIAVDPWFIVARNPQHAKLIKAARQVNDFKPSWVVDNIVTIAESKASVLGRPVRIGCLGLVFKPDIDDLRESPALQVTKMLIERGYDVVAVEPNIESADGISLCDSEMVMQDADVIAVLVAHSSFCESYFKEKLRAFGALDFCGALNG